jgi:hypothetical protein
MTGMLGKPENKLISKTDSLKLTHFSSIPAQDGTITNVN